MSLYAYPTQKAFLVHLLILLFSFFFYLPSLSYSFISDDFFYISFSTFSQVLSFQKGLYHYNPLFWGTLFVLKHIFGITPFPFHFVTIFMHVINTFLVYFLARAFAFRIKQGLLVSLLFSVFFSHYEVVYWITGLSTSLMLFFYLIGILFLISYVQTQKISFFLLYLLAIIASFLAHEYAISLVPLGLIYLFLTKPKKIRSILFLFIPLLLFIGILTLAKVFLGDSSLIVTSLSPGRIIISFIKSFLYIFTANPYLIDHVPHIFLLFVFLFLILLFVIGSFYSHRRMFFLLWIIITMRLSNILCW